MVQTAVDDDARIRLVVAHDDPGVPNWIDTEHQPEGMLVYRSIGTRSRPDARVPQVVPIAALRDHLPARIRSIDAAERREQLARRRAARARALRLTMAWSPQPRPQWVTELNAFGRQLGSPAALVPLDEASLLDTARATTGLDDFGDDGWREPFGVFLRVARGGSRSPPARPDPGAQRDRARAREPARGARDARAPSRDPRARPSTRRCSSSAPADRAPRSCTSSSPRIRRTASRARGSSCTRARRPSARRTRPIRASRPPTRSTRSGI